METIGTSREQMQTSDHQVSIDIKKLGRSMSGELKILPPLSDECCIYRVPKRLRLLNGKAYEPQVVSIGPFHHGREELKAMEDYKRRYLKDFLAWTDGVTVEDLIQATEEREARLRNCYAEVVELESEDFVRMMLLDAAFVIMVIVKRCFPDSQSSNDRVFHRPWMIQDIVFDIILLENQLPFFFLEDLLALSKPSLGYSMINLTCIFLKGDWGFWVTEDILDKTNAPRVEHFVDLLRIWLYPAKLQEEPKKLDGRTMPSATELCQAGVSFQLAPSKNIFDIKFDKNRGRLEIPRIMVLDGTEILLRNLQAFEQCYCCCSDNYVADYITMINLLVSVTRDVEILVQKGIIENWLSGNDAVLKVLHNLNNENYLQTDKFYFSGIVEELNVYCRKRRNKWKATLRQNYFNNPWAIISVIAAGILLILTVIQAVCSIIQVLQLQ